MKTAFFVCGKTKASFITMGIEFYLKRIRQFTEIRYEELESKKATSKEEILKYESDTILKHIKTGDKLILLDERGKLMNSAEFSSFLNDMYSKTQGKLIFIAGGAYGFSKEIYSRSDILLSLSLMTFTHELVRLVFLEQLYRALTIQHNHPYHH